ncbi:MAG: hypothetical protein UX97_C0015G0011, partial [Candidatus Beckwithbacteria bacterium GW2011_GWA2_47_25]
GKVRVEGDDRGETRVAKAGNEGGAGAVTLALY